VSSKKWFWLTGLAVGSAAVGWWAAQYLQKQRALERQEVGQAGQPFEQFNKRLFRGPKHLQQEMGYLLNHPAEVKAAFRCGRVSKAFAKRIMLAVTGGNNCRYCSHGHARLAAEHNISQEQVARLLAGDLGQVDPAEAAALAFAIHYAETNGRPAPEMVSKLENTYGADTTRDVLTIIRVSTLGNLAGNTLDAFLGRLWGRPAQESSLKDELATLGLMLMGIIPFSIAFSIKVALVEAARPVRPNVVVLQE